MCVKLPFENLDSNPYSLHPTNTYTYGVTIAPKVCGGQMIDYTIWKFSCSSKPSILPFFFFFLISLLAIHLAFATQAFPHVYNCHNAVTMRPMQTRPTIEHMLWSRSSLKRFNSNPLLRYQLWIHLMSNFLSILLIENAKDHEAWT